MKRRLLITAVTVIALSLTVYGTLAYLTANATAHNVITAGNVKIELLDQTVSGNERIDFPKDGLQVMPNTSASKEVSVKNLGNTSWIRVYLDKQILLSNHAKATPEAVANAISLNLNQDDWMLGSDGFYYYKKPLKKDEITAQLFTKVSFSGQMGNEYQNSSLTIKVYAQAVQNANNDIPKDGNVTMVKGWPKFEIIPTPKDVKPV